MKCQAPFLDFFFFNDTATTEIYTLSLHDALPISRGGEGMRHLHDLGVASPRGRIQHPVCGGQDRKSTRLNSSHSQISYAVFCLKKKEHSVPAEKPCIRTISRTRKGTAPGPTARSK